MHQSGLSYVIEEKLECGFSIKQLKFIEFFWVCNEKLAPIWTFRPAIAFSRLWFLTYPLCLCRQLFILFYWRLHQPNYKIKFMILFHDNHHENKMNILYSSNSTMFLYIYMPLSWIRIYGAYMLIIHIWLFTN